MGLFMRTVPIVFKQYLSYQEVGIVAMATLPFNFKVLWAPIVELYYVPSIGKRKTWVVSM